MFQVANQQGVYLGSLLNQLADPSVALDVNPAMTGCKPFHYRYMGSFAYVGDNKAVLQVRWHCDNKFSAPSGLFCVCEPDGPVYTGTGAALSYACSGVMTVVAKLQFTNSSLCNVSTGMLIGRQ